MEDYSDDSFEVKINDIEFSVYSDSSEVEEAKENSSWLGEAEYMVKVHK